MAEQERKTKAERREEKRQRRLEEEAAAAAAASRDQRRRILYGVSLVAVVAVLLYLAFSGRTPTASLQLTQGDAEDARAAAGCEVLDVGVITDAETAPIGLASAEHIEPATAPSADVLYVRGRPTASGPHYTDPLPIVNGIRDEPVDERGSTHNLEHGSIIVWIDEAQVPASDVDDIAQWVSVLNESGFAENSGRAGIMASYVDESGIDSGKALAVRAWGQAMDCDSWDRDWANAFTIDHYGTNGIAPERAIAPFPVEVLSYGDGDGGEPATDTGEDTDTTEDGGDADTSEDGTDEPTEEQS